MKHSITFKKLILLFSMVVIPFFLLSIALLHQNNTAIQNRTFTSIQEKTELTSQALTNTIAQIYHTATEVAEQANLRKLAKPDYPMGAYERAQYLLLAQEQQTSITNANQYIDNFIIYYRETRQAYNSKSSQKGSFFYFTQEEYQQLIDARNSSDFLILNNQQLTEIIHPSSCTGFFIRVDLSSQAITTLLEETFLEYEPYYLLEALDSSYRLTNLSEDQLLPGQQAAQISEHQNTQAARQHPSHDSAQQSCYTFPDKLVIDGKPYYHFSSSLPYGGMQIHYFFPEDRLFADTRLYQYLNLCLGLFVFFACCFFVGGCYMIIHKPIQILRKAFQDINDQDYSVRIIDWHNSDFSYLYQEFNHMAKRLGTLIEKDYQQQLLLNKAELKQLQAQINPHFLYNSFFLLRRLVQDELYEEAQKMLDTLGLYFKYITRNSQEYMPLCQEYHHALLYCEIQQMRFEDRIRILTDTLPEEYSDLLVPKLIIQPILENAFLYGIHDKVEDGLLRIRITGESEKLFFFIEDNGEELSDRQLTEIQQKLQSAASGSPLLEMTGILNIQRRLTIYSNGSGGLMASRSPLGGLKIELSLPIHPSTEQEEQHIC